MKPIYIVGTGRDVGKTTTALGLLYLLRQRGLHVGYIKPLGQRVESFEGHTLHVDARLIGSFFGMEDVDQVDMAVPLPSGQVEKEVHHLRPAEMLQRVIGSYEALAKTHDLVVVEGMGHVAMGACLGVSAAEVCRGLGARMLLVSGGGIGRAIDEIVLCGTFLQARGAHLAGVVVNKVWPAKYERVKAATTLGLANLGIRSFGTVPFQDRLSNPTMRQVRDHIGGVLLGGEGHMEHHVRHTIIAAMEAGRMIRHIKGHTLVITPGDRTDNIMAALRAHMLGDPELPAVSGLIVTGDILPDPQTRQRISEFHLPVIAVKEDTFTTASRIVNTVFKITPDDPHRIEAAIALMSQHIDVAGILQALESPEAEHPVFPTFMPGGSPPAPLPVPPGS